MYLTPDDVKAMNLVLAERHRFDQELMRRCGPLLDQGYYQAAVQQAFTILEVRLRERTGQAAIGQSSGDILKTGLGSARAPLAVRLGLDTTETAALRDLLSGFFRVFRNPAAHTLLEYEADEAQAILAMVNLLLRLLDREAAPEPKTKYELFFRAVAADLPRHLPLSLRHATLGPTTEEKSFQVSFPGELPHHFEVYFRRSVLELAYHLEGSPTENQQTLVYLRAQTAAVQACFGGQIIAESAAKSGARFGHYLQPKPELSAEAGFALAPLFAKLIACVYPHALAATAVATAAPPNGRSAEALQGDAEPAQAEPLAEGSASRKRKRRRGKRGSTVSNQE
ncbi:MAG TPA: TIGR02391 family protein [Ardenticatenaceae bacterium]|nr:TIGR02391 family protein [Ardenticatenaceae bacterium]